MKSKRKEFGELEFLIIKFIEKNQRATVQDVLSSLEANYAYTTIMTVMTRLYEKDVLKREKTGRSFSYSLKKKHKSHSLVDKVKSRLFKGKSYDMITYLLNNNTDLEDDELEKIEKLIKKYKNEP